MKSKIKISLFGILWGVGIILFFGLGFYFLNNHTENNIDKIVYNNRIVKGKRITPKNHNYHLIILENSEIFYPISIPIFNVLKVDDTLNKNANSNILKVKRGDSTFIIRLHY